MKNYFFFTPPQQAFSPHISRLFSARSILWAMIGAVVGVFLLFGIAQGFGVFNGFVSSQQHDEAMALYEKWRDVVSAHPDYRDGYIMVAWYAKVLGKQDDVNTSLQYVANLDPTYAVPEVLLAEVE